jgi:hypothetical protein
MIVICLAITVGCNQNINTVSDPHFDESGMLIRDTTDSATFEVKSPTKVKFYVEVSGSMNGFFRANCPTDFKSDVWEIVNYFSPISGSVTELTNDGSKGNTMSLQNFKNNMAIGAFVSSASTKVPLMISSIINDINADEGEVAVMISDMEYSPVGQQAPEVLQSLYSTDISKIFSNFDKSVCLVGATSSYLDKAGVPVTNDSPYYYLILGKGEEVAFVRDCISTLLSRNNRFIGNIETGNDYGELAYSFGMPYDCDQLDEEPTFIGFNGDTCTVNVKIDISKFRWCTADEELLKNSLSAKALYGSNVEIDNVSVDVENVTGRSHDIKRKAIAKFDIKLYDLISDCDVVEWKLNLPDNDVSEFSPYFTPYDNNDKTKTYSLDNFIRGMFECSVVNKALKENYILISRKV